MPERKKCEPGCECNRHRPATGRSACSEGCSCKRHNRPSKVVPVEERRARDRDYAARRRAADREPSRAATRRWSAKNPDYRLKYKFSMTREQWEQLLDEQRGLCYLCNEPLDIETPHQTHVDHDHSCCRGERSCGTCVRGLACFNCNVGIAKFGEDPERLRRVADNLEMANRRLRSMNPASVLASDPVSVQSGSDAPLNNRVKES